MNKNKTLKSKIPVKRSTKRKHTELTENEASTSSIDSSSMPSTETQMDQNPEFKNYLKERLLDC